MEEENKRINVIVPASLHKMIRKLCAENGLSITQVIVKYLNYLEKKTLKNRIPLDEHSEEEFELLD